jgi:hypothetical protein
MGSAGVAATGAGSSVAGREQASRTSPASDESDEDGDTRSGATRRTPKPKSKGEPKLEFRLIEDQSSSGFDLVPDDGASGGSPSAPSQ